jgi:hypothetical protein
MSERLMDFSAFSFLLACLLSLVTEGIAPYIILFVTAPTFTLSLILYR